MCVNIIIFSVHEQFGGKRESRLFLLIVRRVIFNLNIYTFKSFSENCLIFSNLYIIRKKNLVHFSSEPLICRIFTKLAIFVLLLSPRYILCISNTYSRYHRVNDVQRFRFSRPAPRKEIISIAGDKEKEVNVGTSSSNEFASLWLERTVLVTSYPLPGILRWFPVTSNETYLVSPLRNAIETMETTNTALRDLIVAHKYVHNNSVYI